MPATDSLLNRLQVQGRQVYSALQAEIERMQDQLEGLRREASRWRAALQGDRRSSRTSTATKTSHTAKGRKRGAAKKTRGATKRKAARRGPTIDWDGVLKRLPKTFTGADLEKATPVLAKRPKARVMALARWSRAKAIKKVGDRTYAKK
ncbi:MAG: hypothetical protein FJ144_19800 [Deltaproteobacteria bacterium]|nr:hypothetical protein [Deltaproteobacteria bacterium]